MELIDYARVIWARVIWENWLILILTVLVSGGVSYARAARRTPISSVTAPLVGSASQGEVLVNVVKPDPA